MEVSRKSMAVSVQEAVAPLDRCDRFSALPDVVIYRIFKFLEPNETVRFSLISTRFRKLCLDSPYLYFYANFDSRDDLAKRAQFGTYLDKILRMRENSNIGLEKFLLHWFCHHQPNVVQNVSPFYIRRATKCNVKELDLLLGLDKWKIYSLPDCVYECKSLEVLRLNLQNAIFLLSKIKVESVQSLFLESLKISDSDFGVKISWYWMSLTVLNLESVHLEVDIKLTCDSLQVLKISNSKIRSQPGGWSMSALCQSLKVLNISGCQFGVFSVLILDCQSLEKFIIHRSLFEGNSKFKIASRSLQNIQLCGSSFSKSCSFSIFCQSVKQIKISSCQFNEVCHIEMDSSDLEDLSVSDSEVFHSRMMPLDPKLGINLEAEKLQELTINSWDEYFYEFPLSFHAPNVETIIWKGNPVDFSGLERFVWLKFAVIDIKPSCQHKSDAFACHCNLVKSSIYCVAMLLQSLQSVSVLNINMWPIKMFFMQNDEPIMFGNLIFLNLMVDDSLEDQILDIASFLEGSPNLRRLVINCKQNSPVLGDPNFMDLLGLCPKSYDLLLIEDSRKVEILKRNKNFWQ